MSKRDQEIQRSAVTALVAEYLPLRIEYCEGDRQLVLTQSGLGPEEDDCIYLPLMQARQVAKKLIELVEFEQPGKRAGQGVEEVE